MKARCSRVPFWAWLACLVSPSMLVGGSSPMDVGVGALSPDGSLYQLEYACAAAARGALVVGVEAAGSVVLVCARSDASPLPLTKDESSTEDEMERNSNEYSSERSQGNADGDHSYGGGGGVPAAWSTLMQRSSSRADSSSSRKLVPLAPTLGCAASGLLPDAGVLIQAARASVANHDFVYGAAPSVEAAARACGDAALSFSRHPRLASEGDPPLELGRPLAVQLLVAGCEPPRRGCANPSANTVRPLSGGSSEGNKDMKTDGCGGDSATPTNTAPPAPLQPPPPTGALYSVAPTGAVSRWHAKAIGSGAKEADRFLGRWLQRRVHTREEVATTTTKSSSTSSGNLGSISFQNREKLNQPAPSNSEPDESPEQELLENEEATATSAEKDADAKGTAASSTDIATREEAAASAAARLRMGTLPPSECEACRAAIAAVLRHLKEQSSDPDAEADEIEVGNSDAKPTAGTGDEEATTSQDFLPKLTVVDVARVEVAVARPSGFRVLSSSEIVALLGLNN